MAWDWYAIKTVAETFAKDTPDETVEVNLDGVGIETIRFIKGAGDSVGVIFRDYILFPNMNNRNPFTKADAVGAMIYEGQYWVGINKGS